MTWLWRLLLLGFGAEFRRRHGADILSAIDAERREPRYRGRLGGMRLTSRVTVDLIASATVA